MSDEKPEMHLGPWRWVLVAVLLLVGVYPLVRWRIGGGQTAASALETSLAHYQAGRYQEAIAAAKAALATDPNLAEAYNNLAVSYLQLRRHDDAIEAANTALRLRPGFQLAKNNLAWIQREQSQAARAIIPAGRAGALVAESLQHAQAGRFRECLDTATQAANLDATLAPAFNNSGFCAGQLQQWDVAIRNLEEAIRLNPGFQLARNNLASIRQQRLKAEGSTSK